MLLSYRRLIDLVNLGVVTRVKHEMVNACSIDLTLGRFIQYECSFDNMIISLKDKETLELDEWDLGVGDANDDPYHLRPGEFVLAQTEQMFNLPDNIAAEYKLKSSLARSGLNHALAGWCDPGWHGSVLTLELNNITQKHILKLEAGMKIGQIIFYEVDKVPEEASYKNRGQYNNDKKTTSSRGLR